YISAYLSSVLPYLGLTPSYETEKQQMPALTGLSKKEAIDRLRSLGISYEVVGEGSAVLSQDPAAGALLHAEHGKAILYLDETVSLTKVPSLVGKTFSEAVSALLSSGLNLTVQGVSQGSEVSKSAHVISQSLPPGQSVARGTEIILYVLHTNDSD
ncbi:MAG: PASTA domain-containing protein, partial [Clostridia bacterium]|nr:PASTA domain-containing protein [Clostridia bacterium]